MADNPLPPIISFTSGKGGCGKTTIAVNFAYTVANARSTNKVLVIDFDISNRGSTGIFSQWTKNVSESLTLTRILKGEYKDFLNRVIQIKEGYYFVPATSNAEELWKEPGYDKLNEFVEGLRKKIYEVAVHLQADCVVLDCFCGIDVLTTSGSACADHTIIVNEPDIVTFTGSLSLKAHLDRSFKQLKRTPELHFVINRVRSDQKVEELNALYRDNLMQEVKNAILTYIPYNNKIFNNFGSYPFFAEILPRSLFARKIEQIAFVLFVKSHPHLLRPKVQKWTEKKFKKIYLQSIDKSAVDTEYLIVRLISVPVMIGLLLVGGLILAYSFRLRPHATWVLTLLLGFLAFYIYFIRLTTTIWILARLHFTLANFLYRLGLKSRFREMRIQEIGKTVLPFISGVLIMTSIVFIVSLGTWLVSIFGDAMFKKDDYTWRMVLQSSSVNYGSQNFPDYSTLTTENYSTPAQQKLLRLQLKRHPVVSFYQELDSGSYLTHLKNTRFPEVAMEFPLRGLIMDSSQVSMIDFLNPSRLFGKARYRYGVDFDAKISYRNTEFNICTMPYNFLDDTISDATFNYCLFPRMSTTDTITKNIKDQFVHSELKNSFEAFSNIASGGNYNDVVFSGLFTRGIFFRDCSFSDCEIELNSRHFIALANCNVRRLALRVPGNDPSDTAFVFVADSLVKHLVLDPRIKVYRMAQFKERVYTEIYQRIKILDQRIGLYESIKSFEDGLPYVYDKSRSYKNLTELYLMTYDTIYYPEIEMFLDSLEVLTRPLISVFEIEENEVNWADRGIYYMLGTSYAIMRVDKEATKEYFEKFHGWIYNVAAPEVTNKLNLWDFGMWNNQMLYNADKLTESQIELFNLLQDMAFSETNSTEAYSRFNRYMGIRTPQRNVEKVDIILKMSYEKERIKELEQIKQSYYY